MRIDMTLVLQLGMDYELICRQNYEGGTGKEHGHTVRLTVEQARALRDQITKHLRGAGRDKENKVNG